MVKVGPGGRNLPGGPWRSALFSGSFLGDMQGVVLGGSVFHDYDVTSDGERFVMFTGDARRASEIASVNVVSGWSEELDDSRARGPIEGPLHHRREIDVIGKLSF